MSAPGSLPDWARVLGSVPFAAVIRSVPADFDVTEVLAIDFSGDGEHDFLWVEKTAANTQWVARCLARYAAVPLADIGFAGLKDRHAVTRQWFSVRRPVRSGVDWQDFAAEGVRILDHQVHRRKLRRGAHRGNAFRIALRAENIASHRDMISERLEQIRTECVPNYFGEQRFGRNGGNLQLACELFGGRRLPRSKRSFAMSAARAFLFNEVLDTRVRQGTWNTILAGELANLDGSASIFAVREVSDELVERCSALDIHPSGSLWGDDAPLANAEVAAIEMQVAQRHPDIAAGLVGAGVAAASRPLRLHVRDLGWEIERDALWLEFFLDRGCFATVVLRELAEISVAGVRPQ